MSICDNVCLAPASQALTAPLCSVTVAQAQLWEALCLSKAVNTLIILLALI